MSQYRTVTFGENIRANYFDCTDLKGNNYVSIELRRQADQGPTWFIKGDLDGLERVIKRADEIMRSPNGLGAAFRDETISDYKVTFSPWPTRSQPESLALKLETTEQNRQVFGISLDRLKAVTREGQDVERELGYDQKRWLGVVYANSLTRESDGRTLATVFKSVENSEEARLLLRDNEGKALYSEPQRKPLERGEVIEVRLEETLELSKGERLTVESQLDRNKQEQERSSQHFVVAKWGHPDRPPVVGEPVTWNGIGEAYNGKFKEFRAKPAGAGDRGEPAEEMHVLIRKDRLSPFNGIIQDASVNKQEMIAKLALAETAERKHQEISTGWNEQNLGLNNRRHEF